jgi:uncharacterized protein YjiS (DUF1127 family)
MHPNTIELSVSSAARIGERLAGARRAIRGIAELINDTLALWDLRARSRRDLARMDEHLLRDVGLDPLEARREANKPFWRE